MFSSDTTCCLMGITKFFFSLLYELLLTMDSQYILNACSRFDKHAYNYIVPPLILLSFYPSNPFPPCNGEYSIFFSISSNISNSADIHSAMESNIKIIFLGFFILVSTTQSESRVVKIRGIPKRCDFLTLFFFFIKVMRLNSTMFV